MTHNEKVASYKAYFQTGDPQFIPAVYEKTAHANEVQAWKDRWSKTASKGKGGCKKDEEKINWCRKKKTGRVLSPQKEKEARAGHPANVALARALSPGILPGMNSGGSKVHVSHNGDFNHDISSFIEEGVDPGTQAYLRGTAGEKTAAPEQPPSSRRLSDILRELVPVRSEKTASRLSHGQPGRPAPTASPDSVVGKPRRTQKGNIVPDPAPAPPSTGPSRCP